MKLFLVYHLFFFLQAVISWPLAPNAALPISLLVKKKLCVQARPQTAQSAFTCQTALSALSEENAEAASVSPIVKPRANNLACVTRSKMLVLGNDSAFLFVDLKSNFSLF